jgi:dihydrofolate synthase/folylpolyglutamate synthase
MTDAAYRACLEFLYGRLNYERVGMPRTPADLRLGRMRRLLRHLGDPQRDLAIVHVAGTKGKGSTAAMLASALVASGRRTGLFCSPHLHRLEERFRLDGRDATPTELVELTDAVRDAVAALDAEEIPAGRRGPTFFEITTAMGLLHFRRRQADAVVLEVGMGGRLDSTNAVHPLVSVITSISFDHTKQLGNTLGAIAGEKAGIIKRGRPSVSGVTAPEPAEVIRQVARRRHSALRELDRDFHYRFTPPSRPLARPEGGTVAVTTWQRDWGDLPVPLLGPHQAHNTAVALATLDAMAEQGMEVSPDAVRRGFASVAFPARVEVLGERPWLVVDGAHNVASAEALAATIRTCLPEGPRTLVFGTTREKDLEGQLRALLPLFDRVVVTKYLENPRAVPPAEVAAAVVALGGPEPERADGPAEALAAARAVTPADGTISVTGSLFLAAETRALLLGIPSEPAVGVGVR